MTNKIETGGKMAMTITEMRELKKQNGYTLEKIVDRSGLDFEIVAKIFSEDDTIGQKEFCKMLSYSEIRICSISHR